MPIYDKYTPQQIAAIRSAIRKGRQALMEGERHPRVFASAFIGAGGLHLPGEAMDRHTRLRMEIHILANINGRHCGADEEPRIYSAIRREVARIFSEYERFQVMMTPHLVGYQLIVDEKGLNQAICKPYVKLDAFGLGPGVIPPHEVVVLPPCCVNIRWKPLYETTDAGT